MLHSKNANYIKVIFIFIVLILISSILFLTLGIHKGNLSYALSQRVPKLIAIIFTGSLIAFSTILFQTTTDNRLLTPNVMGLDSFYVLIQTTIVFLFGSTHLFIVSKKLNFLICVALMVLISTFLYNILFKKEKSNVILIVLVGIILGTLFSSLSKFMQIVIDPNEYLTLQNKLFASFSNINVDILIFALIMILIIGMFIFKDMKYLDVMSLGRDHAINLGVDYCRLSFQRNTIFNCLILGLLVVNVTRQVIKTYKHFYLIIFCVLISVFTLIFGQLLLERILKIQTPVSVVINLIGGVYFMYLLLKESKTC